MNNDNTTKTITHISLCSGYGGIDIGLKRAIPSLRTIAYSEIEAFVCANLVSKMEKGFLDAAPIWTDLKKFPWEFFSGKVDILSGGFPCQPFSSAGKRNADEDERHLFPYILEGIKVCRPRLVFLENVEGIISAKLSGDGWRDPEGTPVLLHVLRELERVGYKATAGIFSASEVGAPHQRKRVFILAYNDSNGSGESGLLRKGTDGSVVISNGEARRVELADSCNNPNTKEGLCQEGSIQEEHRQKVCTRITRGTDANLWPSRPGQTQYWWEPPRVVGNTTSKRSCGGKTNRFRQQSEMFGKRYEKVGNPNSRRLERSEEVGWRTINALRDSGEEHSNEAQSSLGRDTSRPTSRMVYAELCHTCDSRNDELRLLGNGVVPQTCTKAFITLLNRLLND